MANPTFFPEAAAPRVADTRWRILQKILGATIDGGGSGTAARQWFNGHGAPAGMQVGQTAGIPAWYQDLDTGIIWADATGIGTWSGPN